MRRMSVAVFNSVSETYSEKCLCCLTNHGDLYVITLPDLKRQISTKCLRKEDIRYEDENRAVDDLRSTFKIHNP